VIGLLIIGGFTITVTSLAFLLGFDVAARSEVVQEQWRMRTEATLAARRMHDLTRQAFVSMAERAEQLRDGGR